MTRLLVKATGDEKHPGYFTLDSARSVTASLVEDSGAPPSDAWRLEATLQLDGTPALSIEPTRRESDGAVYSVPATPLRPWTCLVMGQFIVTAALLADPAIERKTRLRVLSPLGALLLRVATAVLLAAALHVLILFPQTSAILEKIEKYPVLVVAGTTVSYAAFKEVIARWLMEPRVRWPLSLVAAAFIVLTHWYMRVVVNHALEPSPLGYDEQLAVGDFAFIAKADPPEGFCYVQSDPPAHRQGAAAAGRGCVEFPKRASLWLLLTRGLLLAQETLGCPDVKVPREYLREWQRTGRCRPSDGLKLERVDPRGLNSALHWGTSAKVTAELAWDAAAGEFDLSALDKLADARVADASVLPASFVMRMQGREAIKELELVIAPGDSFLIPQSLTADAGMRVLQADIEFQRMPVGTLFGLFTGAPNCDAVTTSARLSALLVHGGSLPTDRQVVAQFRAASPGSISVFPFCWAGDVPPASGELHLDASFVPSEVWTLEVPRLLMPARLAVLDRDGSSWGTLFCEAGEPTQPWRVGPIRIEPPRPELQTLARGGGNPTKRDGFTMWHASAEHGNDEWAWACWQGAHPPEKLGGSERWSAALRDPRVPRVYVSDRALAECYLCLDRSEPQGRCEELEPSAMSPPDVKRWYGAYGPAHCDPAKSHLCKGP